MDEYIDPGGVGQTSSGDFAKPERGFGDPLVVWALPWSVRLGGNRDKLRESLECVSVTGAQERAVVVAPRRRFGH